MPSTSTAAQTIRNLYKSLLRNANKFPQYNYKNFALRKIKEDFSDMNLTTKTSEELDNFIKMEKGKLEQLKRMIKVQSLYFSESTKVVIEGGNTSDL